MSKSCHANSANGIQIILNPAFVNTQPGSKAITVPIIVLADNVSASLSEAILMAIHVLPNSAFVGETTFGATGPVWASVGHSYKPSDILTKKCRQ